MSQRVAARGSAHECPTWRQDVVHAAHIGGLPVREAGMVQLGRGDPVIVSQKAEGPNANILRMKVGPKGVGHVVPGLHWTAIFAPLSLNGDYLFNGRDVGEGDIFLISSQLGCHAVGSNRDNLSCGLRTPVLSRMVAAHSGLPPEEVALPDMRLSLGRNGGKAFRNFLVDTLRHAGASGNRTGTLSTPMELALYETMSGIVACRWPAPETFKASHKSDSAIVRAAMNAVDATSQPLVVSDLCAAAGVSRTQLYESFSDQLALSPAQFVRKMRLTTIRNALSDTNAPPRSVKDATLKFGVANGGRLASEYRALFGENPSATLTRTLGQVR